MDKQKIADMIFASFVAQAAMEFKKVKHKLPERADMNNINKEATLVAIAWMSYQSV